MGFKSETASSILLVISVLLASGVCGKSSSPRNYLRMPTAIHKTIRTDYEDIIDCVDIHKQPAFDHPAVKNHSIQMRPSFYPEWIKEDSSSEIERFQPWLKFGRCIEGTIPILRAREQGNEKSNFQGSGKKVLNNTYYSTKTQWKYNGNKENAVVYLEGKFYGAKADVNIWKPNVEDNTNEYSSSQLWIQSASDSIEFGVQVYPHEYGDGLPRLFVFWTNDSFGDDMSCYNLHCQGFVQTNNQVVLGGPIDHYSKPHGDSVSLTLGAYKDGLNGNWVFTFMDSVVGYWPGNLFSTIGLSTTASHIQWGGEISNENKGGVHTTTEMGSGQFPDAGNQLASYFRKLVIIDEERRNIDARNLVKQVTNPDCYDLHFHNEDHHSWGTSFFYGGPGGFAPKCSPKTEENCSEDTTMVWEILFCAFVVWIVFTFAFAACYICVEKKYRGSYFRANVCNSLK